MENFLFLFVFLVDAVEKHMPTLCQTGAIAAFGLFYSVPPYEVSDVHITRTRCSKRVLYAIARDQMESSFSIGFSVVECLKIPQMGGAKF